MSETYVGIDLGGSTLKAVLTDGNGKVLARHVAPAGGKISLAALIETTRAALEAVSEGKSPVGMCIGGAIQPDGTMLATSTNLPNLAGLHLVSFFQDALGRQIRIENDARAAMRGEAWSGAAQSVRNAIAMTFGTGIGAGLMLDRKIVTGSHGRAGEIGIWKLDDPPATGEWFSFEDTAAPGRVEVRTGKRFAELFASGEARGMLSRAGRAMANAHLLLDLEMAVLLGGIAELGEPLRAALEHAFRAACPEDFQSGFDIRLGAHGALAGAIGAASLWRDEAL